ncbi:DUF167 family protein [Methylovirgula sp. 4M-Z18]|uniref:DUF167 family protein n=1 Tax=Methylovirgula sp. 4M-Z18 TaxID=2293567 RepID=UPI000E2EC9EA|nr:DUF167 family protein [Methylovirgula sp. 4M-Z18]RFB79305.1 DUF167 domain-containing protein [Methylovirgula sp. 4M-Z18]
MAGVPWSQRDDAVLLSVRLTPKAARDEIEDIVTLADGTVVLKVRVRAIPEAGKANAALIRLMAKALQIPESRIDLRSGATGRVKILELKGDPSSLVSRITELAAKV